MAIGTDATIHFFGTQDVVTAGGGTSAVTDTSFSVDADAAEWTNDDDATKAGMILKFQYPSGTITAGGILLFASLSEVDSTNDEPLVDSGWSPHYLGMFRTDTNQAATTDTYYTLGHHFELPNLETSQKYKFFVKNSCGVTMTAGWTLTIAPVADGPHG